MSFIKIVKILKRVLNFFKQIKKPQHIPIFIFVSIYYIDNNQLVLMRGNQSLKSEGEKINTNK